MTQVFEIVTTDAEGNVLNQDHVQMPSLRVTSDEIIPKLGKGSEAYIIDKVDAAVSNGPDKETGVYTWTGSNGKTAAAGQPWAALFE